MDRNTRMTVVPQAQLAGLAMAIERIGGDAAKGKGADIIAQTGEATPTYGDVVDLGGRTDTFDLALKNAGASLPAGKVGRVLTVILGFGPETPVCRNCGDLAVEMIGGDMTVRSAGQACPGCGSFLEESGAARPYVSWIDGRTVPPTVTHDHVSVPGDDIPLTDDMIREEIEIDLALEVLLASEGVPLIQFLLWLYHGPEKSRFARSPRKALAVLENPLAETFAPNVTRNWVKQAAGYRVQDPVVSQSRVPPPGASRNRTLELRNLLVGLFTQNNEMAGLAVLDGTGAMRHALPGNLVSRMQMADAVVDQLEQRGLIDGDLFAYLRRERGGRTSEIDRVAMLFASSPTDGQVVHALAMLLPGQLAVVMIRLGVHSSAISGNSAPQAKRAVELVEWATGNGKRDELIALVRNEAPALL